MDDPVKWPHPNPAVAMRTKIAKKSISASSRRARPAPKSPKATRDPDATRLRIMQSAIEEFSTAGFGGARVDRISKRAGTADRMLYYYYGNKERLFSSVIEKAYADLLRAEQQLRLDDAEPEDGLRQLIAFTWNYYVEHPEFIRLLNSENLHQGRNVKRARRIGALSHPFLHILKQLLNRGAKAGVFRPDADPVRMYMTIAALGYFYLSNRYTLSHFLNFDLMTQANQRDWLAHITTVVMAYLRKA